MPTRSVDLRQVSVLSKIVLRGGDFAHPAARKSLLDQYARPNVHYPDLQVGWSCLFRPGASLDKLAREGTYPNGNAELAIVQRLITELASVTCEPVLYFTPIAGYPDQHTLAMARSGQIETGLGLDILDALIRAMTIVDNPYRQRHP